MKRGRVQKRPDGSILTRSPRFSRHQPSDVSEFLCWTNRRGGVAFRSYGVASEHRETSPTARKGFRSSRRRWSHAHRAHPSLQPSSFPPSFSRLPKPRRSACRRARSMHGGRIAPPLLRRGSRSVAIDTSGSKHCSIGLRRAMSLARLHIIQRGDCQRQVSREPRTCSSIAIGKGGFARLPIA